jgi:hypothetical protein
MPFHKAPPRDAIVSIQRLDPKDPGYVQDCVWYLCNEEKREAILDDAFTGTFVNCEIRDGEFEGRPTKKVRFTFHDSTEDRNTIFVSQIQTTFTKGLALGLLAIGESIFFNPVSIIVKPGRKNSTLVNVLKDGRQIRFNWIEPQENTQEEHNRIGLELITTLMALSSHDRPPVDGGVEATPPPPPLAPIPKSNPLKDYEIPNDIVSINTSIKDSVQRLKILGKYSQEEWSQTVKTQFGVDSSSLLSATQRQILAQMLVERLNKVESALESNRAEALKEMGIEP